MDDKDLVKLTEADARSKSNSNQIEEIKDEIKEIKSEQKALNKIACSIEVIANNMQTLKDGLDEVKIGQEKLGQKMDAQIIEVRNEQKTLDSKIDDVKNTKGKKIENLWDRVVEKIVVGVAWGAAALALLKIFGVAF